MFRPYALTAVFAAVGQYYPRLKHKHPQKDDQEADIIAKAGTLRKNILGKSLN